MDGRYVDDEALVIPVADFEACDLERGYESDRRYDLVSSLEVAEHLDPGCAATFVASLCRLGDLILFSAAIPGQEGTRHVNEQYPSYWVALFRENGFEPIDCLRMAMWDSPAIDWWYRQNMLFFVRESALSAYPSLQAHYHSKALPFRRSCTQSCSTTSPKGS